MSCIVFTAIADAPCLTLQAGVVCSVRSFYTPPTFNGNTLVFTKDSNAKIMEDTLIVNNVVFNNETLIFE